MVLSTAGRSLQGMTSTDEVVASSIPVDLSTNTPVMLMRLVMDPTNPGDIFEVDARARVTNDCGPTRPTRTPPRGSRGTSSRSIRPTGC